jgi:glycosyltransferase involved in cell wall biosynthesis
MGKHAAAYQKLLDHEGIAHRVTFLPFLSESELIAQYQGASALLLPSFAEGFGIPMLEAMATGTPVIASHAASLPEVGGSAARYFDPGSISEMTEALVEVLGNDALRTEMARRGRIEVQRYAPEVVAEQVISFWQEVAGVCPRHRPQSSCSFAILP